MAYISFQPTDFFSTILYVGTGATDNAVTGVGFQPDATWIKDRDDAYSHRLWDAVNGATKYNTPDNSDAQGTNAQGLQSFDADGFTVGSMASVGENADNFVSWNWKAGTTSGISGGSITPTAYSFNTTSGFSIITYNGTGSSATIPHGLGATPRIAIVKRSLGQQWCTNVGQISGTANNALYLDATNVYHTSSAITTMDATTISLGTDNMANGSGEAYTMYAWTPIKGYSKMHQYRGNASSTDGPFVYCGFRPAFILIKAFNQITDWMMFDDKREGYNVDNDPLYANANVAEGTADNLDILSNGFKIRAGSGGGSVNEINTNGEQYIYMAFAEFPIVSSNSKPGTAR